MAYTVSTDNKRTLTWDNNPNGAETYAIITGNDITEFQVQNAQQTSIVYSLNQADLLHLQTVIGQLLAELAV